MSTGWIWTFWTAALVAWSAIALVYDLGQYELAIFMAGAIVASVVAYTFTNTQAESPQ